MMHGQSRGAGADGGDGDIGGKGGIRGLGGRLGGRDGEGNTQEESDSPNVFWHP